MTRRRWHKCPARVTTYRKRVGMWFEALSGRSDDTYFGYVRLEAMYQQAMQDMPGADLELEGCDDLTLSQFQDLACFDGGTGTTLMWVLVFVFSPHPF